MEAHNEAVASISARLKQFYERREPFRVYHGSTNSTRTVAKSRDNTVDTSALNHVLEIDESKKTALVEPNVPMDALVSACTAHGLIPLVVMEFPGITVGGGFSGSAGESSSCRHGPFDATVNRIEIVLPDGEVAQASKTDRPDLFWGAASAFGTLGVVTLLEVQLRAAKPFVELTHYRASSFPDAVERIQTEVAKEQVEFVDGIAFSAADLVVCSGRLVDAAPAGTKPRHYLRRRDPWFYLDVRARTKGAKQQPVVDFVPLADYLFRWDRGGFWVARYAFDYFLTPFNRLTRAALDGFLRARVMYHALHKSGLSDTYVIQDVGVPFPASPDLARWVADAVAVWPLWLCPIRVRRDGGRAAAAHGLHADFADPDAPEYMLNLGVWGPGPRRYEDLVRVNRGLEARVAALGGKKTLYAQAYYTEDEFWQVYDRAAYDAVRERYRAAHLPSVYDKVKVDDGAKRDAMAGSRMPRPLRHVRPFQGLYGVYKAWRGGDYLLQSKKKGKKRETTTAAASPHSNGKS
ncbi:FAD-binding domain-containing protein [Hypoxylon sp. FL1284]|nr:FAD-binding domain-containing protein [Hypoxylon sp. FL1284]